jgi:hypothetical protein
VRWLSGRRRLTRNQVYLYGYREFESHPHRFGFKKYIVLCFNKIQTPKGGNNMTVSLVLIFAGFALVAFAVIAENSSRRAPNTVAEPNDPIHPEVKVGAWVTKCTGGMITLAGFVNLIIHAFSR